MTVGRVKRMIRYNTATWKFFSVIAASFCFFLEILRWVRGSELRFKHIQVLKFRLQPGIWCKIDQRGILCTLRDMWCNIVALVGPRR